MNGMSDAVSSLPMPEPGIPGSPWSAVPEANLLDVVVAGTRRRASDPVIQFEDGVCLTGAEFLERASHLAGLLRQSVRPGDGVAVMLENRAEFLMAWVAITANRAITVSLNPRSQASDCAHVLRDSACTAAIVEGDLRGVFELARSEADQLRNVLYVDDPEPGGLEKLYGKVSPLDLAGAEAEITDVTNVYYTSGTTGLPKGCMLDHSWWLRMADLFIRMYSMHDRDRLLCCLPFYYGDPPWMFVASLNRGTPFIAMRRFSVSRFWPVVDEYGASLLFSIGAIPALLLKQPPAPDDRAHPLRLAVHLGIPKALHHEIVQRWGFPWVEAYGLTETGLVTAMPLSAHEQMIGSGSIGLPCPEAAVRVVDDLGAPLPHGAVGQLSVRGPGMMRGYLNRPDATRESFKGGGWFLTGDLGYQDDEGWVYFVGRSKDIIRRSGENVAAAEVEGVLREHPLVLDAAVVPVDDDLRGEEVLAYVLAVEEASPGEPSPADVVDFCANRLARHKVPRYVSFRDGEFPRTPSMRIKKDELRLPSGQLPPNAWDRYDELNW
jgi:carnitine-CoA ligase